MIYLSSTEIGWTALPNNYWLFSPSIDRQDGCLLFLHVTGSLSLLKFTPKVILSDSLTRPHTPPLVTLRLTGPPQFNHNARPIIICNIIYLGKERWHDQRSAPVFGEDGFSEFTYLKVNSAIATAPSTDLGKNVCV